MENQEPFTQNHENGKPGNAAHGNKKRRNLITALIFGIAFLICVFWLVRYFSGIRRAGDDMEKLKEAYVQEENTGEREEAENTEDAEKQEGTKDAGKAPEDEKTVSDNRAEGDGRVVYSLEDFDVPQKEIDFQALKEENPDIYAWITIPNTPIDYPVLQSGEEADYYLMHNLDGSYGYPGCIYTQYYNSMDWTDNNTVIYGHNMKDGSMFAVLHNYKDTEFFADNPYIYIYGEDGVRAYRIFAAYETSDAHLLLTNNTDTKEGFAWYLGSVFGTKDGMGNNFDRSLGIDSTDKIISLETCIANKATKRYVVQAVLVAWEKEQ